MVLIFPLYLITVYFSSKIIDYFWRKETADIVHFSAYGVTGLMIEWFLIGLSPWSNPEAHPGAMFIFQVGMFSYWATVSFVPRLFTDERKNNEIKKTMLKFYFSYFVIVYIIAFLLPVYARFAILIPLIIVGYSLMNIFYLSYFLKSFRNPSKIKSVEKF